MRTVTARFANGTTIRRGSLNKIYSHAWLVTYSRDEAGAALARADGWSMAKPFTGASASGFASSEELARRSMQTEINRWKRSHCEITFSGVVPTQTADPSRARHR